MKGSRRLRRIASWKCCAHFCVRHLLREGAKRRIGPLPRHLADMASSSLSTGLRRANLAGLRWDSVDLKNRRAWVRPDQAKARKAIPVPLNEDAIGVMARQVDEHCESVFSFRRKQVHRLSTKAWHSARQRPRITDFLRHGLRHTRASWLVQDGAALFALRELGG